jgi:hypothetical protein
LSRLQKFQEEAAYKNEVYLQRQFQLDYAIHLDDCFHNQKKGDLNITNVIQSLDLHYHINRISVLNRFLLQQKEANIAISKVVKSSLAQEPIREEYLLECPILNIHYVIHGILQKEPPAVTDVQLLFTILRENEGQIDQDSLVEFYTYLRNFCILIINNDPENEEIHVVMHELYKDNLERGFLLYDGKMHPSRYLSIYDNAAKVKKNDWALDFIEKYKDVIIGENESQDIYRFNKARYFFDVGKYRDCLDHIPATFPFIDYLIIAKRVELKALYELNDDLFSYKLDTFKMYLSRTSHKLFSEQQRLLHTNFANFLTQIISAPPGDHKRADRIIDRLHAKKQTAEWRWLLAKAQELKQK